MTTDKKIKNKSIETFRLGYDAALDFFEDDEKIMNFLNELDEEEKEHFVFGIYLNHEQEYAELSFGNYAGNSKHLYENSDRIDSAHWENWDYEEVIYFLNNYLENFNMDNILKIYAEDAKINITDFERVSSNLSGNFNIRFKTNFNILKEVSDFLDEEIDNEPYFDRRQYNCYEIKFKNLYKADNRFSIRGTNLKFNFDVDISGIINAAITLYMEYLNYEKLEEILKIIETIKNGDLKNEWMIEMKRV